jgi:NitT/TauT family transport system permease protein
MMRPSLTWQRMEKPISVTAVLVSFFMLWEVAVRLFDIPSFLLPPPSQLATEFTSSPGYFLLHAGYTLWTTIAGFGLALILGVLVAIGIVYSTFLERTLYTLLIAFNSVPKVALAPLFVIWLGTGSTPKVAIAFTIAVFSIVINAVFGLRSVDPDLLALARTARASELQILWKIRLSNAVPSLFSGMKIAMSVALVGAIVGEFVAGTHGLGQVILVSQSSFQIGRMFIAITLLGLLGTVLFYAVELAERLLIPWHISQRAGNARSPGA